MKYQTAFAVKARPKDVFAAIHEYRVRRNPNAFFHSSSHE